MVNVSLNPRGLQEETHNNEGIDCDMCFFYPVLAALFAFVSLPSLHWSLLFLSAPLLSGESDRDRLIPPPLLTDMHPLCGKSRLYFSVNRL